MSSLRNGTSKSCGCLKKEKAKEVHTHDLTDKQFGLLTAIKVVGKNEEKNINIWLCDCECGGKIEVRTDHLNSGEVRSCGCLKKKQDKINLQDSRDRMIVDGVGTYRLDADMRSDNKSGYKGVSWSKRESKWRAFIGIKGEYIHLGYFRRLIDAIKAREDAELKYHKPYIEKRKYYEEETTVKIENVETFEEFIRSKVKSADFDMEEYKKDLITKAENGNTINT